MTNFPFDRIRHLLVDLDGVFYRGDAPLPGGREFIDWLRHEHIGFRMVTNNSTLTPDQYVVKLGAMGIRVKADEIFTSALATARFLRQQNAEGNTALVIGEEGLRQALADEGIRFVDDRPDWVIVGLDKSLTYDRLTAAALAIEAGARFLATNADASFPIPQGLAPGTGAILAALEATTGKRPSIVGKPRPTILELAMRSLGGTTDDTAMLGDRLDTDIAAANVLGMPSILVFTGVSTRAELDDTPYHPNLAIDNLTDLQDTWGAAVGAPGPD
ncbi:MAG: HAD-IIA family hydrolase [Chloroflexota bacterium]